MKLLVKLLITLLLFISQLYANNTLLLSAEEQNFIKNNPIINVGAERNWAPYDFIENGKQAGLAKEYIDIIKNKTGLDIKYVVDDWDNILKKIKTKEIDLIPILSKNTEREKFMLFTNSFITNRDYVFAKNKLEANSLEELNNKTIVVVKGHIQEEYIRNNYPKINITYADSILESIDAVLTEKADFMLSTMTMVNYLLKKHHLNDLYPKFAANYQADKLYMGIREDSPILKNIIQKVLNSITREEKNKLFYKWTNNPTTNKSIIFTTEEDDFIFDNKQLVVANELSYKPYDYNEEEVAKGYVIDYIKILFSKVGIEPIFKADTWSNIIEGFKDKKYDILPIITKNEKREKYISFTKSHLNQNMSIVTKVNNTSIINIDDLNGKTVALARNWNMTKFIKKYHPKIKVIEYNTVSEFLDAVSNNYAEATILDNLSANYHIKSYYPNKLHITGSAEIKNFNSKLHIGVQKDKEILKDILEKGMLLITKEEQERLDNKWTNLSDEIYFTKNEAAFIENNVVNISFTQNWAPFSFVDNNEPYGLGYDFWKIIQDKANLKINLTYEDDFTEGLESIKNKKNDIIIATSKTKDREKYSIFSDEYFKSPIGIATLKDQNYISSGKKLIGKKVAVGKNYTAHKLLKESYPDIDFVLVNNIEEAFELVSKGKVFAVVDNMPVLIHGIKSLGYSNIKITGTTGIDFKMNILIRDDYQILQSIINKVLKKITPHEKELIYNKWFNLEYEEIFDYSLLWQISIFFIFILLLILYKNNQLLNYQKKLEKTKNELENSLKNFKLLIDLNIAGVIIVNNNKIKYSNNEIVNILGYKTKSQLINRDINTILEENLLYDIYECKDHKNYEMEAIKVDNSKIPILLTVKNINYDNKDSFIFSIIDLTEIKNKEELMFQQSKMASLGEMIGNIAHQWRQPLSAISTAASGIKVEKEYDLLDKELLDKNLDSIINTTMFLSQTISDFQNYIKEDKEKRIFDIKDSIEEVLNIINASLKNTFIEIMTDIESTQINGFKNELNQALLNIFTNAKDAFREKEGINKTIYINSYKNNSSVIVEIIDTAGGIDEEILNNVFEPYFTTKHKYQGTGLGLYMTHKIITESMKGKISIENNILNNEKGVKVTLDIPI